jgi:hypothetical protein
VPFVSEIALTSELTPRVRRHHARITGTPVVIGEHVWLLAEAIPELSPVWDDLIDANALDGGYDPVQVVTAAYRLLAANYQVSANEGVALLREVTPADLAPAVERAIFGPDRDHITYSVWARSALLANGLDPEQIPAADRRHVLDHLVAIGRARPMSACITSLVTCGKHAGMVALARNCIATQEENARKAAESLAAQQAARGLAP